MARHRLRTPLSHAPQPHTIFFYFEEADHRRTYKELREPVSRFVQDWEPLAVQLFREGLVACRDDPPFKLILEGLTPGNVEIVNKLDALSQETLNRLELLNHLTQLPPKIRDALSGFMKLNLLKKGWGELYTTFAIKLQLDPWMRAAEQHRFVFIRDYEEIACFFHEPPQAEAAFRQRLEKDLEAILDLVNGTLWSIMYKDIKVWNQVSYCDSNRSLLDRAKNLGTDLRRLFAYEKEWMDDPNFVQPLAIAAVWHKEYGYPCRYVEKSEIETFLIEEKAEFLASCLVNETVIEMDCYFRTDAPNGKQLVSRREDPVPNRYIYRCNSDSSIVETYKRSFDRVWHASGEEGTAERFLEKVGEKNSELLRGITSKFVASHGVTPGKD